MTMPWPRRKEKGSPRSYDASNCLPSVSVPCSETVNKFRRVSVQVWAGVKPLAVGQRALQNSAFTYNAL